MVQINVRGWTGNKKSVIQMINDTDADIALINEHGCKTNQKIKIFNYNIIQSNKLDQGFNGSAIAVKKNIKCRLNDGYESDLLSVAVEAGGVGCVVATDYIPPRVGYLHYPDYHRLFSSNEAVYFVGDLNGRCRMLGHGNTNPVGGQLELLMERGHVVHRGPSFPTFITGRSATAPDIILTNKQCIHNMYAAEGPPVTSDHTPIILTIAITPIQIPIKERYSFVRANWEGYKDALSGVAVHCATLETKEEVEQAEREWTEHIGRAAEGNIPKVKYRTVPGVKVKGRMKKLWKMHQVARDLITFRGPTRERYRRLNRCKTLIKEQFKVDEGKIWNELVEKIDKKKGKDFWTDIKRVLGGKETRGVMYLRDHHNNEVHDDLAKERLFREHWSNIFRISDEENEDFDQETEREIGDILSINQDIFNSLDRITHYEHATSRGEIREIINSFKDKAPGPDKITKQHLTNLPINMIDNLVHIINSSINLGYVPSNWKTSIMVLIPKIGKSPHHAANYRPISLLNIASKVMERVVNREFNAFIEEKHLVSHDQHGFRKSRGTDTATAVLYELIVAGKANEGRVNVVSRDIKGAFDKVWIDGLVGKMVRDELPHYLVRFSV